jgi:putative transposase
VKVGRELLADRLDDLSLVRDVIADRGYRGLAALAARKHLGLHIKAPPNGSSGFVPLAPLYKVEHAFARLGRWRRLSRCYEGTEASARAWLEVVCVAYLFARLRTEPT